MKQPSASLLPDETAITEIMIRPDGRVYVFGLSYDVLDLLSALEPHNAALRQRLAAAPGPRAPHPPVIPHATQD
jgi:hypothetical protein